MGRRVMLLVNQTKPEVVGSLNVVRQAIARAGGQLVAEHKAEEAELPTECNEAKADAAPTSGCPCSVLTSASSAFSPSLI